MGVRSSTGAPHRDSRAASETMQQMEELTAEVLEMRLVVEGMEKERDFYFGKLRDIEVIVQESADSGSGGDFPNKVLGVLYATEDGFAVPEDEVDDEAPCQCENLTEIYLISFSD